jgi:hypothetical protein
MHRNHAGESFSGMIYIQQAGVEFNLRVAV